jgi:hypothetical protein
MKECVFFTAIGLVSATHFLMKYFKRKVPLKPPQLSCDIAEFKKLSRWSRYLAGIEPLHGTPVRFNHELPYGSGAEHDDRSFDDMSEQESGSLTYSQHSDDEFAVATNLHDKTRNGGLSMLSSENKESETSITHTCDTSYDCIETNQSPSCDQTFPCKMRNNCDLAHALHILAKLEYDYHRKAAYRKAAAAIQLLDFDVESGSQLAKKGPRKVPGIGLSISKKIDEFLLNGSICRIDELKKST